MSNWRDIRYEDRPVYPETLDAQEAALSESEQLRDERASRERLNNARHRPKFHFTRPEGWLNDPNGLCFWEGRWHMFYQAGGRNIIHWGHAVSEDNMLHWRDLPFAIFPHKELMSFSGGTCVDHENHRVIAAYYGYTGYDENGYRCGVVVSTSSDPLLLNWTKVKGGEPVIPDADARCWEALDAPPIPDRKPYQVFDSYIWKEDGVYYILTGGYDRDPTSGRRLRQIFLHRCVDDDLLHWEYVKPFLDQDRFRELGDDGACPYFLPFADGKRLLLHFSHRAAPKYLIGDYDKETYSFRPFSAGRFTSGYQVMVAPSAFALDDGSAAVIFNTPEAFSNDGWYGIMTLPRKLTLGGVWHDELYQEPFSDLSLLHDKHVGYEKLRIPSEKTIVPEMIGGDSFELSLTVKGENIPDTLELEVFRSPGGEESCRITFYKEAGSWNMILPYAVESVIQLDVSKSCSSPGFHKHPPEIAPVVKESDEDLNIRVFGDRSIVEVFVNGKTCLCQRAYPMREDSRGIAITSYTGDCLIEKLDFWTMRSIWE